MGYLVAGIVDVFAPTAFSGNPLAVVEGAEVLSDDEMRLIAREFNQAETTFVLPSVRADRRLRSFTASGVEVPLSQLAEVRARTGESTVMRENGQRNLTVRIDNRDRLLRAGGKSTLDLLRRKDSGVQDAPDAVLLPGTDDEVAGILRYCSQHGIAVVPFGGGSSVVGGVEPIVGDGYAGAISLDARLQRGGLATARAAHAG